jgi:hypothetical protein
MSQSGRRPAGTAASVFPTTVSDEHERVASVLSRSSRVDAQTIEHIEAMLWHCRQQDTAAVRTLDERLAAYGLVSG